MKRVADTQYYDIREKVDEKFRNDPELKNEANFYLDLIEEDKITPWTILLGENEIAKEDTIDYIKYMGRLRGISEKALEHIIDRFIIIYKWFNVVKDSPKPISEGEKIKKTLQEKYMEEALEEDGDYNIDNTQQKIVLHSFKDLNNIDELLSFYKK